MKTIGPKPTALDAWGGTCRIEDLPVALGSGVERRFITTMAAPPAKHQEAKRQRTEDMTAWDAESERLARQAGTRDASALCDAIFDRFTDAVDVLSDMVATTPAGLAAKASAFLAIVEPMPSADQQETDLARSLARDAVRIGGGVA